MSHVLLPCNFGTWSSSQGCATGVLVPLLHGVAGECQPCTMCSPSATELAAGWGHTCLHLGDTPAFLSPVCLLTAWRATSLIICRGSLLAASFLSVPSSFLWPCAVSKSEPLTCLHQFQVGEDTPLPPSPQAFYCSSYSVTY